MNMLEKEFNNLIVETFHLILKEEMIFVKSLTNYDVSAREIHIIESIRNRNENATISDIAEAMQITLPSVTVMVNKLETQGYVIKKKDELDARTIRLSLTIKGEEIDDRHTDFHRTMVKEIFGDLTSFEKDILAGAVKRLKDFFLEKNKTRK